MQKKKILIASITSFILGMSALILVFVFKPVGTAVKQPAQVNAFAEIATAIQTTVSTASDLPTVAAANSTAQPAEAQGTAVSYTYPDSFYITNIVGHRQAYHLSCEAANAVDWARYFGVPILEYTFQTSLPHSDNPDYGFVGDVNSTWGQIPPYAYGVYSGPVADLLQQYGLPAKSVKGLTLDEVRQKLSVSKPIIVWVIGKMEWSGGVTYVDEKGRSVVVAPYEHVVILTGYDVKADTIRFMSNGNFYDVPTPTFLTSWGVLGNMAVIYDK